MIGQKFGKLTVVSPAGTSSSGNRYWHCQCECGNTTKARGDKLKNGKRKSCGCGQRGRQLGSSMWTKELIADYIATCNTKREFREHHPAAYAAAVRNKWVKELGANLKGCQTQSKPKPPKPEPVSNAIYIWKAVDWFCDDLSVYKIGVTSSTYNGRRIGAVAREAGVRHEIVVLMQVKNCFEVEKQLLTLGNPVSGSSFNGSTEFRALTPEDLTTALKIIFS